MGMRKTAMSLFEKNSQISPNKPFTQMDEKGYRLLSKNEALKEGDEYIGWDGYEGGWIATSSSMHGMKLDEFMFLWCRRRYGNGEN